MKYKITTFPYAVQHGVVEIPDDVAADKVDEYLMENWANIEFDEPELDYAGTDFITTPYNKAKEDK